ncbi:hypothetical protein ABZN20_18690 [Methylococcus sp. ANG]|uniref:hypothetical protein n=1 Tax=Methylococcus sp. ANG TaxID=3231903 RepID=UPI00345ABDA1
MNTNANTYPPLLELWRSGFVVEVSTGALVRHRIFDKISPRKDGNADAFTAGQSRRLIRWPFKVKIEGVGDE